MKYGIIYEKWAIIYELLDENGLEIIRRDGDNCLVKNWQKINGKTISQRFFISEKQKFLNKLNCFQNKLNDFNKTLWEIELKNIINYDLIYELPFFPKVSVILASFNSSKTIERSIKSIIKQKYGNIELIVIDDCSSDSNIKKIEEVKEKYGKRITDFKLIKNEKNMGAYYSRNLGIKNSSGDIICIQDADDISDLHRISISVYELVNSRVDFILSNSVKLDNLTDMNYVKIAMATLVIKRDFFDRYGFYDDKTRHSGDLELLDRAYFLKYGNYEFDNFWYYLNYEIYKEGFYKHIYRTLYYIGEEKDSITSNFNIKKRLEYLNERRKMMKNKI